MHAINPDRGTQRSSPDSSAGTNKFSSNSTSDAENGVLNGDTSKESSFSFEGNLRGKLSGESPDETMFQQQFGELTGQRRSEYTSSAAMNFNSGANLGRARGRDALPVQALSGTAIERAMELKKTFEQNNGGEGRLEGSYSTSSRYHSVQGGGFYPSTATSASLSASSSSSAAYAQQHQQHQRNQTNNPFNMSVPRELYETSFQPNSTNPVVTRMHESMMASHKEKHQQHIQRMRDYREQHRQQHMNHIQHLQVQQQQIADRRSSREVTRSREISKTAENNNNTTDNHLMLIANGQSFHETKRADRLEDFQLVTRSSSNNSNNGVDLSGSGTGDVPGWRGERTANRSSRLLTNSAYPQHYEGNVRRAPAAAIENGPTQSLYGSSNSNSSSSKNNVPAAKLALMARSSSSDYESKRDRDQGHNNHHTFRVPPVDTSTYLGSSSRSPPSTGRSSAAAGGGGGGRGGSSGGISPLEDSDTRTARFFPPPGVGAAVGAAVSASTAAVGAGTAVASKSQCMLSSEHRDDNVRISTRSLQQGMQTLSRSTSTTSPVSAGVGPGAAARATAVPGEGLGINSGSRYTSPQQLDARRLMLQRLDSSSSSDRRANMASFRSSEGAADAGAQACVFNNNNQVQAAEGGGGRVVGGDVGESRGGQGAEERKESAASSAAGASVPSGTSATSAEEAAAPAAVAAVSAARSRYATPPIYRLANFHRSTSADRAMEQRKEEEHAIANNRVGGGVEGEKGKATPDFSFGVSGSNNGRASSVDRSFSRSYSDYSYSRQNSGINPQAAAAAAAANAKIIETAFDDDVVATGGTPAQKLSSPTSNAYSTSANVGDGGAGGGFDEGVRRGLQRRPSINDEKYISRSSTAGYYSNNNGFASSPPGSNSRSDIALEARANNSSPFDRSAHRERESESVSGISGPQHHHQQQRGTGPLLRSNSDRGSHTAPARSILKRNSRYASPNKADRQSDFKYMEREAAKLSATSLNASAGVTSEQQRRQQQQEQQEQQEQQKQQEQHFPLMHSQSLGNNNNNNRSNISYYAYNTNPYPSNFPLNEGERRAGGGGVGGHQHPPGSKSSSRYTSPTGSTSRYGDYSVHSYPSSSITDDRSILAEQGDSSGAASPSHYLLAQEQEQQQQLQQQQRWQQGLAANRRRSLSPNSRIDARNIINAAAGPARGGGGGIGVSGGVARDPLQSLNSRDYRPLDPLQQQQQQRPPMMQHASSWHEGSRLMEEQEQQQKQQVYPRGPVALFSAGTMGAVPHQLEHHASPRLVRQTSADGRMMMMRTDMPQYHDQLASHSGGSSSGDAIIGAGAISGVGNPDFYERGEVGGQYSRSRPPSTGRSRGASALAPSMHARYDQLSYASAQQLLQQQQRQQQQLAAGVLYRGGGGGIPQSSSYDSHDSGMGSVLVGGSRNSAAFIAAQQQQQQQQQQEFYYPSDMAGVGVDMLSGSHSNSTHGGSYDYNDGRQSGIYLHGNAPTMHSLPRSSQLQHQEQHLLSATVGSPLRGSPTNASPVSHHYGYVGGGVGAGSSAGTVAGVAGAGGGGGGIGRQQRAVSPMSLSMQRQNVPMLIPGVPGVHDLRFPATATTQPYHQFMQPPSYYGAPYPPPPTHVLPQSHTLDRPSSGLSADEEALRMGLLLSEQEMNNHSHHRPIANSAAASAVGRGGEGGVDTYSDSDYAMQLALHLSQQEEEERQRGARERAAGGGRTAAGAAAGGILSLGSGSITDPDEEALELALRISREEAERGRGVSRRGGGGGGGGDTGSVVGSVAGSTAMGSSRSGSRGRARKDRKGSPRSSPSPLPSNHASTSASVLNTTSPEAMNIARASSVDSDSEAFEIGIIISQQEDEFGVNMYDTLSADDDPEIARLVRELGFTQREAMKKVFRRKMEESGFAVSRSGIRFDPARAAPVRSPSRFASNDRGGANINNPSSASAAAVNGLPGGLSPIREIPLSPAGTHRTATAGSDLDVSSLSRSNSRSPDPRARSPTARYYHPQSHPQQQQLDYEEQQRQHRVRMQLREEDRIRRERHREQRDSHNDSASQQQQQQHQQQQQQQYVSAGRRNSYNGAREDGSVASSSRSPRGGSNKETRSRMTAGTTAAGVFASGGGGGGGGIAMMGYSATATSGAAAAAGTAALVNGASVTGNGSVMSGDPHRRR